MNHKQLAPLSRQTGSARPGQGSSDKPVFAHTGNRDLLASLGGGDRMPDGVREQMESALGADLSAVHLHESALVDQLGAEAAASGTHVAFAPGKLDLASRSGLELLGHELSHVVSQSKGEVHGSGVVHDGALERRADADGIRAAAATGNLSPMGPGLSPATGAIQCRKKSNGENFTEAYESMEGDLPAQIEIMRDMAFASNVKDATDDSENEAFTKLLRPISRRNDGSDISFLDEWFRQHLSSARELMDHHAALEAEGYSGSELAFRAKYSPQASKMAGYEMLLKEYGLVERGSKSASRTQALTLDLRDKDPDTYRMLKAAGDIKLTNEKDPSHDMPYKDIMAIQEASKARDDKAAMNRKRPRKPSRWRRGRNRQAQGHLPRSDEKQ